MKNLEEEYEELFVGAFHDTADFAERLVGICDHVFKVFDKDVFVGGLCTFRVKIREKSGVYIYGGVIKEEYRRQGYYKKLLSNVETYYSDADFFLLLPATKELFGAYQKLGYTTVGYGQFSIMEKTEKKTLPFLCRAREFDGDFNRLYDINLKNDLQTDKNFFIEAFEDVTIEYLGKNDGYAVLKDDKILAVYHKRAKVKKYKKALLKCRKPFDVSGVEFDFLLEV